MAPPNGSAARPADPVAQPYRNFLSLQAIIAEARAVADDEGLDAVSMRTLAARLGCTPRALYRHVSGKDEVLELLADAALADVPPARTDLPWPDALCEFLTAMRARLVGSPAVAEIVAQQAVAGPWFRGHADHLVGLLLGAGLDAETAVEAVVALAQFTLGASMPGTGQRLHDTYAAREADLAREALPALGHVARHFAGGDAEARYRSALRRLLRGYEQPG